MANRSDHSSALLLAPFGVNLSLYGSYHHQHACVFLSYPMNVDYITDILAHSNHIHLWPRIFALLESMSSWDRQISRLSTSLTHRQNSIHRSPGKLHFGLDCLCDLSVVLSTRDYRAIDRGHISSLPALSLGPQLDCYSLCPPPLVDGRVPTLIHSSARALQVVKNTAENPKIPGRGNINSEKVFITTALYDATGLLVGGE
jgi:hypothetical protein